MDTSFAVAGYSFRHHLLQLSPSSVAYVVLVEPFFVAGWNFFHHRLQLSRVAQWPVAAFVVSGCGFLKRRLQLPQMSDGRPHLPSSLELKLFSSPVVAFSGVRCNTLD